MVDSQSNGPFRDKTIAMVHGAGGEATRRLVEGLFQPAFTNPLLDGLSDAATFPVPAGRLAITADGYVVQPLVFPGGSIGELAINGTINDLAVSGARPLALLATFIMEAGLDSEVLRHEVEAMARASRQSGVPIVGGDTKVVEPGKGDGMYITTTGVGLVDPRADLGPARVQPGDRLLLSGPIGNHGMAVMLARAELDMQADIRSDTRPLIDFVFALLDSAGRGIKWMRDATRGGVATVLNELARDANVGVVIQDDDVPVDSEVRRACELLGLDPLHVANEGQFLAVLAPEQAEAALAAMRRTPGGERAAIIGVVEAAPQGRVLARSAQGGVRVLEPLIGDPLARIC